MNPKLVALAGPLKGSIFDLEEELSIGREQTNSVSMNDSSTSRRHCVIRKESSSSFKLFDLNSMNGTFVNGIPVKERRLQHNDRIGVGPAVFVFQAEEEPAVSGDEEAGIAPDSLIVHPTARLRLEDALYLHPEKWISIIPFTERMAQGVSALLRIGRIVQTLRELNELQQKLIELIFEIIPAQRGAILLFDRNNQTDSIFRYDRNSGPIDEMILSKTVLSEVRAHSIGLLSNDISQNEKYVKAKSLMSDAEDRVQSLLAAPLVLMDKLLGVIYLTNSDPGVRFDEDHLNLLTAIAGIAAVALENLRHLEWYKMENRRLRDDVKIEHGMIGESRAMKDVYDLISKVARTDSTILITGESGTGKELAARAIHINSHRVDKPFIAINCAALTDTLIESELFGHEKGSFTGAFSQKKGRLEIAEGGTVFLDEIGELTYTLQSKLLRVLQEREFERVGGTKPIRADLRFIAATNRNLSEDVKSKRFREDLFYRLNVVAIEMPPLRQRMEDIPLLATFFAARYAEKTSKRIMGISPEARESLLSYDWPGNVRELENVIERAVIIGNSDLIRPEDLPEGIAESSEGSLSPSGFREAVREAKRKLIREAVQEAGGNYAEAARRLGIHPNNIHRLLRSVEMNRREGD